jgi:hypothetical protein
MSVDTVRHRWQTRLSAVVIAVLLTVLAAGCYASITVGPDQLTEAVVGQSYLQTFTTQGAEVMGMYTTGSLPPGLTFEYDRAAGRGVLFGTPTTAGTYSFGVVASGPQFNFGGSEGSRTYTLVVR